MHVRRHVKIYFWKCNLNHSKIFSNLSFFCIFVCLFVFLFFFKPWHFDIYVNENVCSPIYNFNRSWCTTLGFALGLPLILYITSFILSVTKKGPCQGLCNLGFNPFVRSQNWNMHVSNNIFPLYGFMVNTIWIKGIPSRPMLLNQKSCHYKTIQHHQHYNY